MGILLKHIQKKMVAIAAFMLVASIAILQVPTLHIINSDEWFDNDHLEKVDLYLNISGIVFDLEPFEKSYSSIGNLSKPKLDDTYRLLTPTSKFKQQFFPNPIICSPTGIYMCLRL